MSIIKAKKCEVEIQEQTIKDAACKYVVILSYEPDGKFSKEIITLLLSDTKPFIKKTIDLGNRVVRKEESVAVPEDKKDWFVGNNINDKIYTGSLSEVKDKLKKDEASKLTPDGF